MLWDDSASLRLVLRLQAELASFHDLQYCKTDLIASKGVVFCKYTKSSSALLAMEAIQETGMVGRWSGSASSSWPLKACRPVFLALQSSPAALLANPTAVSACTVAPAGWSIHSLAPYRCLRVYTEAGPSGVPGAATL